MRKIEVSWTDIETDCLKDPCEQNGSAIPENLNYRFQVFCPLGFTCERLVGDGSGNGMDALPGSGGDFQKEIHIRFPNDSSGIGSSYHLLPKLAHELKQRWKRICQNVNNAK
ncbi:MAG: hypothetical protein ACYCOU_07965 [Sulfobacillus sp.]